MENNNSSQVINNNVDDENSKKKEITVKKIVFFVLATINFFIVASKLFFLIVEVIVINLPDIISNIIFLLAIPYMIASIVWFIIAGWRLARTKTILKVLFFILLILELLYLISGYIYIGVTEKHESLNSIIERGRKETIVEDAKTIYNKVKDHWKENQKYQCYSLMLSYNFNCYSLNIDVYNSYLEYAVLLDENGNVTSISVADKYHYIILEGRSISSDDIDISKVQHKTANEYLYVSNDEDGSNKIFFKK